MNSKNTDLQLTKSSLINSAREFLISLYGDLKRKHSNTLAVQHCFDVYKEVAKHSLNESVLVAALLHDVIEDFEQITFADVKDKFGESIATLVLTLTKPECKKGESRMHRNICYWQQVALNPNARLIKLADTLCNLSSENDPEEFRLRYLNEKVHSLLFIECSEQFALSERVRNKLIFELKHIASVYEKA
ncbi:MAG: HD domain-containing protein [Colwellia sp.]